MQRYEAAKAARSALQKQLIEIEKKIAAYETLEPDFLEDDLISYHNGISPLEQNGHREIPVVDQIFIFAHYSGGEFSVKSLTEWLVEYKIYPDLDSAQKGVNPQLHQRANLFKHVTRGKYSLTKEGANRAEQIIEASSK